MAIEAATIKRTRCGLLLRVWCVLAPAPSAPLPATIGGDCRRRRFRSAAECERASRRVTTVRADLPACGM